MKFLVVCCCRVIEELGAELSYIAELRKELIIIKLLSSYYL
jgi:hypothetical protein